MNTKTYTKKQFLEDVAKEARALKKNATKEEIARLNITTFDPNYPRTCLYGQMTESCKSYRAHELIHQCCKRYFHNPDTNDTTTINIHKLRKKVNGVKIKGVETAKQLGNERSWDLRYLSSVEMYIMTPFAKNANLIAFLKGERKDLVL